MNQAGQLQAHDHENDRHHKIPVNPHIPEHGAHHGGHGSQDRHDQGQAHQKGKGIEEGLPLPPVGIAADEADNQRDAG